MGHAAGRARAQLMWFVFVVVAAHAVGNVGALAVPGRSRHMAGALLGYFAALSLFGFIGQWWLAALGYVHLVTLLDLHRHMAVAG